MILLCISSTSFYPSETTIVFVCLQLSANIKMPSSTDSYEVLGPIGSGTFATCKKIRRRKDGRVLTVAILSE